MVTINEQIELVELNLGYYKELAAKYSDASTAEDGRWVAESANADMNDIEFFNSAPRCFTTVGPFKVYGTCSPEPKLVMARLTDMNQK